MLVKKVIKNSTTSIVYKYYQYDLYPSINNEIYRRDIFLKLNKIFKKIFSTNKNLIDLFHYGYANNNNNLDPVICINIDKKFYDEILKINTPIEKINKFNSILQQNINLIYEYNSDFSDDVKYEKKNKFVKVFTNKESVTINYLTLKHLVKRNNSLQKIFLVLFRNKYINNLTGMSAALPPKYLFHFIKNNYLDIELFGSAFNSTCKYYFGLFPDIESDFGCLGNFFNCKLNYGFFYMNPPFVNWLMNKSFHYILNNLNDLNSKITIMVLIPVWKNEDRIHLNKICQSNLNIEDYNEDFEVDILRESKFKKYNKFWCKNDFKYLNYFNYRKINYTPSNIFLVSNYDKKIDMSIFKNQIS